MKKQIINKKTQNISSIGVTIFTITELAKEFSITNRTLRYYEDLGLISPDRKGNRRVYSRRDKSRIRLILMGKKIGLSLEEISEMIELYDLKDGQIPQLRTALTKFNARIDSLESQREEISTAILELSRSRDIIEGLLKSKEEG